ncbi:hypothetical protein GCM10010512_36040 [Streptomyces thermoviolaceus subsp. thermoviolaceus]|nr:hypothetical protein GCM10010499_38090 [Streptomyces thermoviolaceus subsp. apingens]GHB01334.1 hypothetical protein GCM10010512_36040 [Streptomyces thermoviolaceus subsp. thermoviolaceus]
MVPDDVHPPVGSDPVQGRPAGSGSRERSGWGMCRTGVSGGDPADARRTSGGRFPDVRKHGGTSQFPGPI